MKDCQKLSPNDKDYKNNLLFPGRNSLIAFKEVRIELIVAKMELHHADLMIEWLNCELEKAKAKPFIPRWAVSDEELLNQYTKRIMDGTLKPPNSER